MFLLNWFLFGWHTWRGESGAFYRFKITLTRNGIPPGGGIYMFVKRRFGFFLFPLYIGKAANFRSRLLGHERWWEAWWRRGATERHVLVLNDPRDHARIEEDLIRRHKPRMNNIHIPRGTNDAPNDQRLARAWRWRRWWTSLPGRLLGFGRRRA